MRFILGIRIGKVRMGMGDTILKMSGIQKYFPGVHALDDAYLEVRAGEVMALVGENGAGKSTLMKILTGIYPKDGGTIEYFGQEIEIHGPKDAQDKGICIVHQELNLMQDLQKKYSLTYIFISHNLSVVKHLCDRIAVMYLGNMVEIASKNDLFDRPAHPYTQALLRSVPVLGLAEGFSVAFQSAAPSFHPADLLVGLLCGAALRLAVYVKGKNAKKYRHNMEYGSARWSA